MWLIIGSMSALPFLIGERRVEFDWVGLECGLGSGQSWPSVAQHGAKRTVSEAVEALG